MDEKEVRTEQDEAEVDIGTVLAPDEEEVQDEAEFTEETGAKETEPAEPSTETEEESGQDTERAERSVQAEKRRQREAQENALRERIKAEAYRKGLLDAVGKTNPYTGEEIKDDLDVQEFLTMRDIEKRGGDPVGDYRKEVKEKGREKSSKDTDPAERKNDDLTKFMQAYPDIDVNKLLNDARFGQFAGKRIANEGLKDIYDDYLAFTSKFDAKVEAKAQAKAKNVLAKAKASPGSLSGNGDPAPISYDDMSDEEFERVIEKAKRGELKKS